MRGSRENGDVLSTNGGRKESSCPIFPDTWLETDPLMWKQMRGRGEQTERFHPVEWLKSARTRSTFGARSLAQSSLD